MTYRKRRSRSRGRRRRMERPSVSVATYAQLLYIAGQTTQANTTVGKLQRVSQVKNDSGETVNRKIVRVTGSLSYATQPPQGIANVAMFALWAHPIGMSDEELLGFDPFVTGPDGDAGTYEGRPHPRPFGRKMFSHVVQPSGTASQLFQQFEYRTKAKRLLRPGWRLSAGLWSRSTATDAQNFAVGGAIRVVVEG